MHELNDALQSKFNKSIVSLSIPYADGYKYQYFDINAMAPYVEFFSVRAMDLFMDEQFARAASPYDVIEGGLRSYTDGLKVDPSKLILTLPWYGYYYPCEEIVHYLCYKNVDGWFSLP